MGVKLGTYTSLAWGLMVCIQDRWQGRMRRLCQEKVRRLADWMEAADITESRRWERIIQNTCLGWGVMPS